MVRKIDWNSQIGRRLRLKDLYVFSVVAQQGSVSKAAAQLGVSSPTISEVLAGLEHNLGVTLFDRSSKGVELTMYGRAFLSRGLAAFDELRQGIKDIESISDPDSGELYVACGTTLAAAILPPIVERFSKAYPRLQMHVHEIRPPTRELSGLRDRKYDLVMGRLVVPLAVESLGDDVNVEVLSDDRLAVMAGAKSPWARQRKVDLAELAGERWVLPEVGTWNHTCVMEAFHARGLAMPKISLVSSSAHVTTHLLNSGRFITAASKLLARRYQLRILPVDTPLNSSPVVAITLKNRTQKPAAERFIDCARVVMKSVDGGHPNGR